MIGNKDFATLYAGRAAFGRNGGYAGTLVEPENVSSKI